MSLSLIARLSLYLSSIFSHDRSQQTSLHGRADPGENRRIQQTSTRNKITLLYLIKAIEEIYVTNKKNTKDAKEGIFVAIQ